MIRYVLLALAIVFAAFIADALIVRRAVNREFKRRGLTRIAGNTITFVTPAPGWRVAENCTCSKGGQRVLVIVLVRGWFKHQLSIDEQHQPQ